MKTPTYILALLFFVLPLLSEAQQDSIVLNKKATEFKNQIDLDVQFLGVDFLYKHRIGKKLFLGGGFGGGLVTSFSHDDIVVEIIESKIILDYCPSDKIHFYVGPKFFGLILTGRNEFGYKFFGVETGFFLKLNKIELGAKLSMAKNNRLFKRIRVTALITPVIIKIPLGKW